MPGFNELGVSESLVVGEQDSSLLGHGNESAAQRWMEEQNSAAYHSKRRTWMRFVVHVVVSSLALLSIASFWVLQRHGTFSKLQMLTGNPPKTTASSEITHHPRDLTILLYPENHLLRASETRHFSWTITKAAISPDGVRKDVFLINNGFPGPTIEARTGDLLEIEVINFSEDDISLHWHGLHMRGANTMDGAVGLTQDAIKSGENFTYTVPISEQAGTFWYHAHSEVQRGDGLYGGLIVHNPELSEAVAHQYDRELLFLVGDWYHRQSDVVLATFADRTSEGNEPAPDSLLVNGQGYFECSKATHGAPVDCSKNEKPVVMLDKQSKYRVRLVNVGSMTGITFIVPDADIHVFQVDGGQPLVSDSTSVNSIGVLYPAERVDFVIAWQDGDSKTDTEIVVKLDKEYFLRPNFALTSTQSFLLTPGHVVLEHFPSSESRPVRHFNLQTANGPLLDAPLPIANKIFMVYSSIQILNHLNSVPKGFINSTTWEPQSPPLISLQRSNWNEHQLVPWTGSGSTWVELTINNQDNNGHPYHLHGHDFYVVASYEGNGGFDYYNPFSGRPPRGGKFNSANPIKKDTVLVPAWGYVVIRFLADNRGIWALHCHVLWHAGSGMSMAFEVLGNGDGVPE